MKHPNITMFNFLTNKVNVHLDMFSALMMNKIARQVKINKSGRSNGTTELKKQVTNPTNFKNNIGNTAIFGLCTRLETVGCRLANQDTKLSPRKIQ